jgi:hypothetical protein
MVESGFVRMKCEDQGLPIHQKKSIDSNQLDILNSFHRLRKEGGRLPLFKPLYKTLFKTLFKPLFKTCPRLVKS